MNKKSTIIITVIPIIVLFFILGVLHYLTAIDKNFTYPDHVEIYLLAGFITVEIILNMINWILQDKNNVRNDLKDHTKDINKVFIKMTESYIREGRDGLAITLPREDRNENSNWQIMQDMQNPRSDGYHDRVDIKYVHLHSDLYYFEYAEEHLKKGYKDIYKHWKETKKLIQEFNSRPKRIRRTIEDMVNEKIIEFFPNFQKYWGESDNPNFYEPQTITSIIKSFLDYPEAVRDSFVIKQRNEMNVIVSKFDFTMYFLGSKDKIDLEQFNRFINSILDDPNILKMHKEETELDTKIRNELSQFTEKLKVSVKPLKANKLLEGRCDGCPS